MFKFLRFMAGSIIGGLVGAFAGVFILVSILSAFIYMAGGGVGGEETLQVVPKDSILVVDLDSGVDEFSPEGFSSAYTNQNIHDFKRILSEAAADDSVDSMVVKASPRLEMGWSKATDVRKTLLEFKESGKPVVAYANILDEKSLYIVSVSDKIYMHSTGEVSWNGIAAVQVFFKGLADKLKTKPIVFKAGKYKSAVERYTQTKMSSESRQQIEELLDGIWEKAIEEIATSRNMDPMELKSFAENYSIRTAKVAQKVGLIDGTIKYTDFLENLLLKGEGEEENGSLKGDGSFKENGSLKGDGSLKENGGLKGDGSFEKDGDQSISKKDLKRVLSLSTYTSLRNSGFLSAMNSSVFTKKVVSDNKIAVLVLEGTIMPGKSTTGIIGSETILKQIQKLRLDNKIKGLVLRVNSPGGSALASDVIWAEVLKLAEYKPVYVSMGDVAASGGYYISVGADKIFAQENTITGSIGVFSVFWNIKETMSQKLGVSFDRVVTNRHADIGSGVRQMTDVEQGIFNQEVKRVYENFLKVVEKGRKFTSIKNVDNVAQGRIWSGRQAKEVGLVDELGGLQEAIDALASELALEDYKVDYFPKKSPIEGFILGLEKFGASAQTLSEFLNISEDPGKRVNSLIKDISLNRGRVYMLIPPLLF